MKMKTVETVNVKQLASHELSVEQQLYYKEITEVTFSVGILALFVSVNSTSVRPRFGSGFSSSVFLFNRMCL